MLRHKHKKWLKNMTYSLIKLKAGILDNNDFSDIVLKNVEDIVSGSQPELTNRQIELHEFIQQLKAGNALAIRFLFQGNKSYDSITKIGIQLFDKLKKNYLLWGNHKTDFMEHAMSMSKKDIQRACTFLIDGIEWHTKGYIKNFYTDQSMNLMNSDVYFEQLILQYGIAERQSIFLLEKPDDAHEELIKIIATIYKEYFNDFILNTLEGQKTISVEEENDVPIGFFGF